MSRLSIFPPVITVYPNDRQDFNAQAAPPPALWRSVTDGGDIKSDFSLEVDAAGSQTGGTGAHQLFSGIGIVELTIDDQCRPTSTGLLRLTGHIDDIDAFAYAYRLNIDAAAIEVRDEGNVQLYQEVYASVSGDVYRIELSAGFRLFRNGVLKHSRVDLATAVAYPMGWSAAIFEPTFTAPSRIPAPRLIGDWRLGPFVTWTGPSQGNITTTGPSSKTRVTGIVTPGKYTLTAAIEPAADATGAQKTTATIELPPFQVLGPTEVTLAPGQKARFKTNYDAQQIGNLVSWSVVSGAGSFTQGEFTASANAGFSIVRATADLSAFGIDNQVADITVTVPLTITNASGFTAAKVNEEIDFNINAILLPQFISVGPKASGTGNIDVIYPKYIEINDIMLLFVESSNEAVSTPSGWTAVADSPQGTGVGATSTLIAVFWRRVTTTEAGFVTVTDPGDHAIGFIAAFRGCFTGGNPWDVTSGNVEASGSTAVSIPGDTTTVVNCLIALVVSNATDTLVAQTSGYTNTDLVNLTERLDANTDAGNGGGIAVVTGEKATIGAYAATTATLATSSVQARMSIALKPDLVTWLVNNVGSINATSGVWTAPSQAGQTAKVTVTNGTFFVTIEVPVLEVFPVSRFAAPMEGTRSRKVLVSESDDGRDTSRIKGNPRDSYPLQVKLLTLAEHQSIEAFWDRHHPGKAFIIEDVPRQKRMVVKFDSDLVWRTTGGRFEVSFRVKEVAAS